MKYYAVETKKAGTDSDWTRNEEMIYRDQESALQQAAQGYKIYKGTDYRVVKVKYKEEVLGEFIHY